MTLAGLGILDEAAKCVAVLRNRLSAIKAVGSERAPTSEV